MLVRVIKVLVGLVVVANVLWYGFGYTFRHCPPFHVATLSLVGRGPHRALAEAVRGCQNAGRHAGITNRLWREVRQIQEEPVGFTLWQTPSGHFWNPKSDAALLPHPLSGEERRAPGSVG